MKVVKCAVLAALAGAMFLSAPATAQRMSDGFAFMKAVRDNDGTKAADLIDSPGSTVLLYKDPTSGEAAIHEVVKKRDGRWLSYLLGKGARPDMQSGQGDTPLTLAAQMGWFGGAEMLIGRKANVNAPDSRGQTPLILAVQRRDLPMVRLLVESGANPKLADRIAGYNALDYARRDPRAEAVLKIMEQPAKPPKEIVGPKF